MQNWYYLEVGSGDEMVSKCDQIRSSFMTLFLSKGSPWEMAVFSAMDKSSAVVTVYFTPAAKELAIAYGASICSKPDAEGKTLEAGDIKSAQLLK